MGSQREEKRMVCHGSDPCTIEWGRLAGKQSGLGCKAEDRDEGWCQNWWACVRGQRGQETR